MIASFLVGLPYTAAPYPIWWLLLRLRYRDSDCGVLGKFRYTGPTGPDPTGQSPRTLSETWGPIYKISYDYHKVIVSLS